MRRLSDGPALAMAGLAAAATATVTWMLLDDIGPNQAFASPIPYALLALTWFVALPLFVVTRPWHGDKLIRLLLLATLGSAPAAAKAIHYFLTPRDVFVTALILSISGAATAAFWACFKLLRGDDQQT